MPLITAQQRRKTRFFEDIKETSRIQINQGRVFRTPNTGEYYMQRDWLEGSLPARDIIANMWYKLARSVHFWSYSVKFSRLRCSAKRTVSHQLKIGSSTTGHGARSRPLKRKCLLNFSVLLLSELAISNCLPAIFLVFQETDITCLILVNVMFWGGNYIKSQLCKHFTKRKRVTQADGKLIYFCTDIALHFLLNLECIWRVC